MSRTTTKGTVASRRIKQSCDRMQAAWSNSERNHRQDIANRRQQSLWQLLTRMDPTVSPESEIQAIGAPSMADLARFAG